ncbi:MAG: Uma2 family endonuclease [Nocardioidaceae bacterium]
MVTVSTLPRSRPFTRADLDTMPDDGHRYELIDGLLVVTPGPTRRHQRVVVELAVLLRLHCPDGMSVFVAPFDVALADDTVMQPDLLVARRSDLTERDLPAPPVLAVEVLSPSTRRIDLTLKRSRFETAGCPSYWVVDPDVPSVTAWELQVGRYVEVAAVAASQEFAATRPYAVTIRPIDLLDG